jgi:hypothetical protein
MSIFPSKRAALMAYTRFTVQLDTVALASHLQSRGRISQADRRAGLSPRRGGRGLAPSD